MAAKLLEESLARSQHNEKTVVDSDKREAFQQLEYIPHAIRNIRHHWITLVENGGLENDDELISEDVMDKLAEFVDFDLNYYVERLKMQTIPSMFQYDLFDPDYKNKCVELTPNFRYYISVDAKPSEHDNDLFMLPEVKPFVFDGVRKHKPKNEVIIEEDVVIPVTKPYLCPKCNLTFRFTTPQIFKHKSQCLSVE
jgi:hypothetical protein